MKNVWRWPGFILVIVLLSVDSFSQGSKPIDNENFLAKQNTSIGLSADTPLYPGTKPWIVEDMELNYPRAARKFAQAFPDAAKLRWIKEDNALFAYFFINGHKAYAVFTLQGRMNYAVTYLAPADLPSGIAKKIGTDYEQYSVFNVREILICGYTVYRVILENAHEFIHVQATGTDIEEIDRIKKSFSR